MTEQERNEMKAGGVPYTPQQNKDAEAKKQQSPPKATPQPQPQSQTPSNGKLYRKCPTCGAFQEVQQQFAYAPQPFVPQQPQIDSSGRIVNHLIKPMPQDPPRPPAPDKIQSGDILDDGQASVEAQWNSLGQRVPIVPQRG